MQLYFIRHGQSANNDLWDKTRSNDGRSHDPELTETGRRQARILAEYLCQARHDYQPRGHDLQNIAGFGITHVYSSLMLRAAATGAVVADELGLPLLAWIDIHEVGGLFEDDAITGQRIGQPGGNRAYFQSRFPHMVLPESLGEAGWWNRPFEPVEDRMPRAQRFLNDLLQRHGGTEDRVAVISHGDFYNHFLAALLGMTLSSLHWFSMNNVAISRFLFGDGEVRIAYMNRVEFLPRDLVT